MPFQVWIQNRENRKKWNEYMRQRSKRLREERTEKGVCHRCGRPDIHPCSKAHCGLCYHNNKDRYEAEVKKRTRAGKCMRCGRRKPAKNRKSCAPCLAYARQANGVYRANKINLKKVENSTEK